MYTIDQIKSTDLRSQVTIYRASRQALAKANRLKRGQGAALSRCRQAYHAMETAIEIVELRLRLLRLHRSGLLPRRNVGRVGLVIGGVTLELRQ